jgi:hypothetical protein
MSNNPDWITSLIASVQKHHSSITSAASSRIEALLMTQLSERQIPPAELKMIASTLLSDMSAKLTNGETENEN